MKLSTPQVQRFWREWAKSCAARNWTRAAGLTTAEIDAKRKEFLRECGFDSLKDVGRVDGFTKVLNELIVLQGVSVKAGIEAEDLTINKARTVRHYILTELIPCLELYIPDVAGYLTSIMEDKNRWWKIDRPVKDITVMDLDAKPTYRKNKSSGELEEMPSTLEQLRFTLQARLNDKRNEAGDSIHEMKIAAGVSCACALCRNHSAAAVLENAVGQVAECPF